MPANRGYDDGSAVIRNLRTEVERLREALEWIYAEPEDAAKVQLRAREALDEHPS